MPDAKPLTREERDGLCELHPHQRILRYEATVRAAEARIEALRAALEEILWTVSKDAVGGSGEVVAEVARAAFLADDAARDES